VNATLAHMKREPLSRETIYSYVGNGAPMLVRRALREGASDEEVDTRFAHFLSYYRAHMLDNTVPYPGVCEGLAQGFELQEVSDGE
jgi:phosphoglycolate phosphatase